MRADSGFFLAAILAFPISSLASQGVFQSGAGTEGPTSFGSRPADSAALNFCRKNVADRVESRHPRTEPDDRLGADISCFRHQCSAQTDFKMLYPGLPFTEVREGCGKAGALHNFQEEIGHAGLWHSSLNFGTQYA